MRLKLLVTVFLIGLLTTLSLDSQAQFELSGELRFRAELNHGYKQLPHEGSRAVGIISQRSRLSAFYQNKNFSTKLTFQYVGMWGGSELASKTGVWADSIGVNLKEGWLKFDLFENFSISIGRQFLKYDDQRLLGFRNWNQFGLSYDAVKFSCLKNSWQLDAGFSWNNSFDKLFGSGFGSNTYYDDGYRIKSLNFIYMKRKIGNSYLSFTTVLTGVQKPGSVDIFNYKITYGPYAMLKFNNADIKLNAFLQSGHDAISREVSAYMFSVDAGYKISKLRLGAGIDYISGEDGSQTSVEYINKNHSFDLLYGARFKFFGWMNQFGLISSATKGGGLVGIYPNLRYTFNEKHNIKLYYHFLSLQNKVADSKNPGAYYNKGLGSEFDFMYSTDIKKDIKLSAGFSYYFTSETLEALKLGVYADGNLVASTDPYWAWIMLSVKPTFFETNSF